MPTPVNQYGGRLRHRNERTDADRGDVTKRIPYSLPFPSRPFALPFFKAAQPRAGKQPLRTTSDFETCNASAASSSFCRDSSSIRTRNMMVLGLSVGLPIFFGSLIIAPPFVATIISYVIATKVKIETVAVKYILIRSCAFSCLKAVFASEIKRKTDTPSGVSVFFLLL